MADDATNFFEVIPVPTFLYIANHLLFHFIITLSIFKIVFYRTKERFNKGQGRLQIVGGLPGGR